MRDAPIAPQPAAPTLASERLELVWLSPEFISAILSGDRAVAEGLGGLRLHPDWPGVLAGFLRMRLDQMTGDPEQAPWLVRAICLRKPGRPMIGHIGFHGKPDTRGVVEVGYTVFEAHRRQGYAFEAVRELFDWAHGERGITTVRASVSPTNAPSLGLVAKLGLRQVGRQWDQVDGEEIVFEGPWPPDRKVT